MRNYYKQTQVKGFLTGLRKVSDDRSYQNLQEQLKEMAQKCEVDPEDFEFLFAKTLTHDDSQITKILKDLVITAKLKWSEDLKENKERNKRLKETRAQADLLKFKLEHRIMMEKASGMKPKLLK